jgi:transcriptional regulator with XRE-family HTH domain
LLEKARKEAGLSQQEVARRAHTSRPTLSAYEHGRKSPILETAQRVLDSLGFELVAQPKLEFVVHDSLRGPIPVPIRLPRMAPREALASVRLPLHLNWSDLARTYHLADRRERARV